MKRTTYAQLKCDSVICQYSVRRHRVEQEQVGRKITTTFVCLACNKVTTEEKEEPIENPEEKEDHAD